MVSSSPSQATEEESRPSAAAGMLRGLAVGALVAVVAAFAELLANIAPQAPAFENLKFVVPPMAATAGATLLAFLALWPVAGALSPRRLRRAEAAALAAGAVILVVSLWLHAMIWRPALAFRMPSLLSLLLIGVAVGMHVGFSRRLGKRWMTRPAPVLLLFGSYLLGAAAFLIWQQGHRLEAWMGEEGFARAQDAVIAGGVLGLAVLAGVGVLLLASRLRLSEGRGRMLGAALVSLPFMIAALGAARWLALYAFEVGASGWPLFSAFALAGLALVLGVALKGGPWRATVAFGLPAVAVLFAFPVILGAERLLYRVRHEPYIAEGRQIRHVFLITVDTLRADALSCYDGEGTSTPAFDALANDSVVFTRAFASAPWTAPSVTTILTGLSPAVHGNLEVESRLPGNAKTLAESLSEAGYFTGSVGDNPILNASRHLDQGFRSYDFYPKRSAGRSWGTRLVRRLIDGFYRREATTTQLTTRSLRWIDRHAEKDFFFWLHYFDPHTPFEPPAEFYPDHVPREFMVATDRFHRLLPEKRVLDDQQKQWLKDLYLGEVRYVDAQLSRLIETLKERGLYDESLIVLTSDHGEEFWEHGGFGHAYALHHEIIHVPFMVKLPHSERTGRVEEFVTIESITPTLVDLLGVDDDPAQYSYPSIAALLLEPDAPAPPPFISTGIRNVTHPLATLNLTPEEWENLQDRRAVFADGFKYSQTLEGEAPRLFILERDFREEEPLENRPESAPLIERGRRLIERHEEKSLELQKSLGLDEQDESELEGETLKEIRKLGYI